MGYGVWQSYGLLAGNGVGGWVFLWVMGEYGLRRLWLMRESTVLAPEFRIGVIVSGTKSEVVDFRVRMEGGMWSGGIDTVSKVQRPSWEVCQFRCSAEPNKWRAGRPAGLANVLTFRVRDWIGPDLS